MSEKTNLMETEFAVEKASAAKVPNPLGYQPVGKLLLSFSVPAIIQMLVNSIYNIVDQIFIGQGVGYLGNAATTVVFPIMTLIMAFASMIGTGGAAFASIKLGEREDKVAEKALSNQYILAVLVGVLVMVLGLVFIKPLLSLFGAKDSVMPYALDYGSIILIGAPFSTLGISLSNMARSDGSPRMSMYSVLIGAILNCGLDPFYIFVLDWGVKGAAVATITSQILTAVILTVYFLKFGKHMRLKVHSIKLDFKIWWQIIALGFSGAITQGVACVMQTVMNNSLVYYGDLDPQVGGDVALSAMGIVMKIVMILVSVGLGVGIGGQPIYGFNYGARQPERIKKCYFLALKVSTALIFVGWLMCQLFPNQILSIFGDEGTGFTNFAVQCMHIFTFAIVLSGFQMVSTQYFQATGQPLKASLLSSLRQLVLLVPLILILPLFVGLKGILYAGPCADIGSTIIVFCFMRVEIKKLNRWIAEKSEKSGEMLSERETYPSK